MSFYELLKDLISTASKLNNAELNKMLIDLQFQAIEIQSESLALQSKINELEKEIKHLKECKSIEESDIIFNPTNPYFTLNSEGNQLRYCSNCWREFGVKVQISTTPIKGLLKCPKCANMFRD